MKSQENNNRDFSIIFEEIEKFSQKDSSIKDNIIYNKVINDDIVKRCSTILIYVSFKDEVDTLKLIKFFLQNKRVAVPKIENNNMNLKKIFMLYKH